MSLPPLKRSRTDLLRKRLRLTQSPRKLPNRQRLPIQKINKQGQKTLYKEYIMREKKSKYQNRADKAAKEQNRQKSQQQRTARTWGIGIAIVSILLVLSMVLSSVRF